MTSRDQARRPAAHAGRSATTVAIAQRPARLISVRRARHGECTTGRMKFSVVETLLSDEDRAWLEAIDVSDTGAASRAFSRAPMHIGKDAVPAAARLPQEYEWLGVGATKDELARMAILSRAAAHAPNLVAVVTALHDRGDNRERRAVLRALSLLPSPRDFVPLAIAACRTSVQPVFEGIACENPFPATYLPDAAFNQIVLKAFFTGVEVDRIMGLERRKSSELARMARDYAAERRAAGRPLPPDLDRVLSPR